MIIRRRWLLVGIMTLLVAVLLLQWPLAGWLQHRGTWLDESTAFDVLYVMAGDSRGTSRITGATKRYRAMTNDVPVLMTGNAPGKSAWSRKYQRNLTASEWTVALLRETLGDMAPREIPMVPGEYWGTDGELEALACWLEEQPHLRRVAVVTSRYHVRRTHRRARRHLGERYVGMIPADATPDDRAPHVVLSELIKLARDAAGLTRAPLVSRRWWVKWFGVGE